MMSSKKKQAPKKDPTPQTSLIGNTVFCGIRWDGLGIETLNTTAKALLGIVELFNGQHVTVEAGIKIVNPLIPKNEK